MPPRTIDNLGVEVSTRYAQDKEIFDENLIKESQSIPTQTQIEVTSPSANAEIETLLHLQPTGITSGPHSRRLLTTSNKEKSFSLIS